MGSLGSYCFLFLGVLVIDLCCRLASRQNRDENGLKSAGIIALFILCFMQGKKQLLDKQVAVKQYLLSLLIVILMIGCNYLLLRRNLPRDAEVLQFVLILTPLFTLPFYHFLYKLMGVRALSIQNLLIEFRLRGAIALVLSANIIFSYIDSVQNILSLGGHFIFSFLALFGSFSLAAQQRRRPTCQKTLHHESRSFLEVELFCYLASALEVFYYIALVYFMFVEATLGTLVAYEANNWWLIGTFLVLLAILTLAAKFRIHLSASLVPEFYEERALPLSFLFFGIMSVFRFYL